MPIKQNYEPENVVFYQTPCFLIYDSPEVKEYPMHWHNAVEILMPTENIFPVVCGNTEYILQENDILIIPPGELHELKAQKGRRIIMLCDNAMLKDNPALSEINMLLSKPVWINNNHDSSFISELNVIIIDMLSIYDASPPFCETVLYHKLLSFLLKIAEYEKNIADKEISINSGKLDIIRKYIDSCFMNPITLDDLAEAAGYSKYHLSRILNRSGTSFSELLNERRIKAAEIMLHDDSRTVTQIAMDSGFTSITTFNRTFRRIKHCTPMSFREMYRDKNTY